MPMNNPPHKILIWNVRRSSSSNFFIFLLDLIRKHHPLIFILIEAPMPNEVARKVKDRFGYSNFHFVEPLNCHGGLWYFWKSPVQTIDFISTKPSLFHSLIIFGPDELEVVVSAMHALSFSAAKPHFWHRLTQDPPLSSALWLVMGDLNTVTSDKKNSGGTPVRSAYCTAFLNFVNSTSLVDLGFSGSLYTWDNGRPGLTGFKGIYIVF